MAADQRNMSRAIFSKCRNSGSNGRNCTIFGAQGDLQCPFDSSYFDLGVTSRDLSMTLTVFKQIWRKGDVSTETVGAGMVVTKGPYSGFFFF